LDGHHHEKQADMAGASVNPQILRRLPEHARSDGIVPSKKKFEGSPAYEVYMTGAEELEYHIKNKTRFRSKTRPASAKARSICTRAMERVIRRGRNGLEKAW